MPEFDELNDLDPHGWEHDVGGPIPVEDLGTCCACGCRAPEWNVRNVIMLHRKSPTPGRGWGCAVCGLASDGAVAVVCDACLEETKPVVFACTGYPGEDGRTPIGELTGVHEHKMAAHAGERLDPGEDFEEPLWTPPGIVLPDDRII